jgi:hypothetical protein
MTMTEVDELEDTSGDLRGARHVAPTGSREEAARVLDSVEVSVSDLARLAGSQFAAQIADEIILPALARLPRVSDRAGGLGQITSCWLASWVKYSQLDNRLAIRTDRNS